jgi:hypothetical protein
MRWLFVVFVASLCALLWAAISVARHIRRDTKALPMDRSAPTETEPDKNTP